jgi:mannose-6-phosphate isomerase-like protein (cupin superfamily)
MSLDPARLESLRDALTAAFAIDDGSDAEIANEFDRVRDLLAAAAGKAPILPEATHHPLIDQFEPAIAASAPQFAALAAALRPQFAALPWRYGYAARVDFPGLERRMGYAEIVGPKAPFRSDSVCLGLTFLAPETHYPDHRHPAVELYRVIAGHPAWTIEGRTRRLAPPAAVLHRSGARHAMASGEEALLAIYSWTGDIVSPSVWSEPGRRL